MISFAFTIGIRLDPGLLDYLDSNQIITGEDSERITQAGIGILVKKQT